MSDKGSPCGWSRAEKEKGKFEKVVSSQMM